VKVLIAIHGAHSQPEAMQAQRDTWLKDLKGADYKYFLGQPDGQSIGTRAGLATRAWMIRKGLVNGPLVYSEDDIVQIDSPDGPLWEGTYRTWVLNRKTEALARYALKHGYDYVFKCDDDTYVYPDRLLRSGFENYDYSGNLDKHHAPDVGWYRWAQGGAGYWLSHRAMLLVATGLTRIRAEDFAVGQLLAANGITAHHDERYCPAIRQGEVPKSDPITLHKVSPASMRAIHQNH
jgi:hypothetical protein